MGIEAFSIVGDHDLEEPVGARERDGHRGASGMLDRVVLRFADRQKEAVADRAVERHWRQILRDLEPHGDAGGVEKLLGRLHEIGCEAVECVVGGIDRPDDRIDAADQVGGDLPDAAGQLHDLGPGDAIDLAPHRVGPHGDLGELGADLVMQIAGDAGAFAFEGVAAFQLLESPCQPAGGDGPAGEQQSGGGRRGRRHPDVAAHMPRRHHDHRQARLVPGRLAAGREGGHAKPVGAGGQCRIARRRRSADAETVGYGPRGSHPVARPHFDLIGFGGRPVAEAGRVVIDDHQDWMRGGTTPRPYQAHVGPGARPDPAPGVGAARQGLLVHLQRRERASLRRFTGAVDPQDDIVDGDRAHDLLGVVREDGEDDACGARRGDGRQFLRHEVGGLRQAGPARRLSRKQGLFAPDHGPVSSHELQERTAAGWQIPPGGVGAIEPKSQPHTGPRGRRVLRGTRSVRPRLRLEKKPQLPGGRWNPDDDRLSCRGCRERHLTAVHHDGSDLDAGTCVARRKPCGGKQQPHSR